MLFLHFSVMLTFLWLRLSSDPSGRCDLSKGETAEAPPPSAFATPPPAVTAPPTAEDDAVLDAEVEQFFGESTHPPRGDVPNRRPFAGDDDEDDSPAEPQDQAHPGHTDEQVAGKAGLQASRAALGMAPSHGDFWGAQSRKSTRRGKSGWCKQASSLRTGAVGGSKARPQSLDGKKAG